MNWGKTPPPKVQAELQDFGRIIIIGIDFNGKRTTFRVDNPRWEEINEEWHRAHPAN